MSFSHALFSATFVQQIFYFIFFLRRTIRPSNNVTVAFLALGEGWHNYHHVFPWDYKTSELGEYSLNMTTALIDFFAKIGEHRHLILFIQILVD